MDIVGKMNHQADYITHISNHGKLNNKPIGQEDKIFHRKFHYSVKSLKIIGVGIQN